MKTALDMAVSLCAKKPEFKRHKSGSSALKITVFHPIGNSIDTE
jgi:hypothetical protein